MIRRLTKNDDLKKVATLIYLTDIGLFKFLFGEKNKAILSISKLIQREHNAFSYRNIFCYVDGEILGIMIAYPFNHIDDKKEAQDFNQVFSNLELITLRFKSLILKPVLDKSSINSVYIQNICVDEKTRSNGIGSKLIDYYFNDAKRMGFPSVFLDVSFHNSNAKNLYQRKGFVPVECKNLIFSNEGIYRMKKVL